MSAAEDLRRQRAVDGLGLSEPGSHPRLDRITRLACLALDVPMSAVTVLDHGRARFPSAHGFDPVPVPEDETFCRTTIEGAEGVGPLEVADAPQDDRFRDLPVVRDGIRTYVGVPLRDHTGTPVATFCVFDRRPRELTPEQREALEDLAAWAERELVASTEMQQASRVQASLLPSRPIRVGEWDVDGLCLPAMAVGGDFYDYEVTGGVLHVSLGDVMGKGTPAALIAAGVRSALRGTEAAAAAGVDLGVTVTRTARTLSDDLERTESFVTLFEAVIDLDEGEVRYVDAGCGLALVARNDGSVEPLRSTDGPIGLWPDDHWSEHRTRLEPGERLVVVSDGVLDLVGEGPGHADRIAELVLGGDAVSRLDEIVRDSDTTSAVDDVTVVVATRPAAGGAG